ncbi:MAG: hypothetical protein GY937_12365 [bacterium]|nr:hypothetical protein [bacterium]
MNRALRFSVPLALTLLALAASGCAGLGGTRHGQSTSLVDYIDPSGQGRNFEPTIPHLRFPLTVGVAFVPSANPHGETTDDSFTEQEKVEFSERVVERFERLAFVDRIEIIPAVYLRSKGGFTNLDQLKNLYVGDHEKP